MTAAVAYVFISNVADRMLLCLVGVLLSCYSLHVEVQHEKNSNYVAACDFNEHMSCSRVLTSKYARGFGMVAKYLGENHLLNARNCNMGIVFYLTYAAILLFFNPVTSAPVLLLMSISVICLCFYLGYILFFVLRDVCVVCIATYVVNGLLFYLTYSFYTHVS